MSVDAPGVVLIILRLKVEPEVKLIEYIFGSFLYTYVGLLEVVGKQFCGK
jgi:hypothetical protein